MRIAVGVSRDGTDDWESAVAFAVEAESLGVYSIWTAEVWGHDGLTPLATRFNNQQDRARFVAVLSPT